jgi:hypothetical protein
VIELRDGVAFWPNSANLPSASRVWIAYHVDWSGFAVFETEIEALRHAVDNMMHVKQLQLPCIDPREKA